MYEGVDPGFSNRGGAKDYWAHHDQDMRVPYDRGYFRCALMLSEPYLEAF